MENQEIHKGNISFTEQILEKKALIYLICDEYFVDNIGSNFNEIYRTFNEFIKNENIKRFINETLDNYYDNIINILKRMYNNNITYASYIGNNLYTNMDNLKSNEQEKKTDEIMSTILDNLFKNDDKDVPSSLDNNIFLYYCSDKHAIGITIEKIKNDVKNDVKIINKKHINMEITGTSEYTYNVCVMNIGDGIGDYSKITLNNSVTLAPFLNYEDIPEIVMYKFIFSLITTHNSISSVDTFNNTCLNIINNYNVECTIYHPEQLSGSCSFYGVYLQIYYMYIKDCLKKNQKIDDIINKYICFYMKLKMNAIDHVLTTCDINNYDNNDKPLLYGIKCINDYCNDVLFGCYKMSLDNELYVKNEKNIEFKYNEITKYARTYREDNIKATTNICGYDINSICDKKDINNTYNIFKNGYIFDHFTFSIRNNVITDNKISIDMKPEKKSTMSVEFFELNNIINDANGIYKILWEIQKKNINEYIDGIKQIISLLMKSSYIIEILHNILKIKMIEIVLENIIDNIDIFIKTSEKFGIMKVIHELEILYTSCFNDMEYMPMNVYTYKKFAFSILIQKIYGINKKDVKYFNDNTEAIKCPLINKSDYKIIDFVTNNIDDHIIYKGLVEDKYENLFNVFSEILGNKLVLIYKNHKIVNIYLNQLLIKFNVKFDPNYMNLIISTISPLILFLYALMQLNIDQIENIDEIDKDEKNNILLLKVLFSSILTSIYSNKGQGNKFLLVISDNDIKGQQILGEGIPIKNSVINHWSLVSDYHDLNKYYELCIDEYEDIINGDYMLYLLNNLYENQNVTLDYINCYAIIKHISPVNTTDIISSSSNIASSAIKGSSMTKSYKNDKITTGMYNKIFGKYLERFYDNCLNLNNNDVIYHLFLIHQFIEYYDYKDNSDNIKVMYSLIKRIEQLEESDKLLYTITYFLIIIIIEKMYGIPQKIRIDILIELIKSHGHITSDMYVTIKSNITIDSVLNEVTLLNIFNNPTILNINNNIIKNQNEQKLLINHYIFNIIINYYFGRDNINLLDNVLLSQYSDDLINSEYIRRQIKDIEKLSNHDFKEEFEHNDHIINDKVYNNDSDCVKVNYLYSINCSIENGILHYDKKNEDFKSIFFLIGNVEYYNDNNKILSIPVKFFRANNFLINPIIHYNINRKFIIDDKSYIMNLISNDLFNMITGLDFSIDDSYDCYLSEKNQIIIAINNNDSKNNIYVEHNNGNCKMLISEYDNGELKVNKNNAILTYDLLYYMDKVFTEKEYNIKWNSINLTNLKIFLLRICDMVMLMDILITYNHNNGTIGITLKDYKTTFVYDIKTEKIYYQSYVLLLTPSKYPNIENWINDLNNAFIITDGYKFKILFINIIDDIKKRKDLWTSAVKINNFITEIKNHLFFHKETHVIDIHFSNNYVTGSPKSLFLFLVHNIAVNNIENIIILSKILTNINITEQSTDNIFFGLYTRIINNKYFTTNIPFTHMIEAMIYKSNETIIGYNKRKFIYPKIYSKITLDNSDLDIPSNFDIANLHRKYDIMYLNAESVSHNDIINEKYDNIYNVIIDNLYVSEYNQKNKCVLYTYNYKKFEINDMYFAILKYCDIVEELPTKIKINAKNASIFLNVHNNINNTIFNNYKKNFEYKDNNDFFNIKKLIKKIYTSIKTPLNKLLSINSNNKITKCRKGELFKYYKYIRCMLIVLKNHTTKNNMDFYIKHDINDINENKEYLYIEIIYNNILDYCEQLQKHVEKYNICNDHGKLLTVEGIKECMEICENIEDKNDIIEDEKIIKLLENVKLYFNKMVEDIVYKYASKYTLDKLKFEYFSGFFIRSDQDNIIENIIFQMEENKEKHLYQMLMGKGKSSVIVPNVIIGLQKKYPEKYIIIITLETLVNQLYDTIIKSCGYITNFCLSKMNEFDNSMNPTIGNVYVISDVVFKKYLLNIYKDFQKMSELRNSIIIMDEVDEIINPIKSELNIVVKNGNLMEEKYIRPVLYSIITNLKETCNNLKLNIHNEFPYYHISDSTNITFICYNILISEIYNKKYYEFFKNIFDTYEKFSDFINDKSSLDGKTDKLLFLRVIYKSIKYILPNALTKIYGKHYGFRNEEAFAVPYESDKIPSKKSTYSDPYYQIAYTICSCIHGDGLTLKMLSFTLYKMLKNEQLKKKHNDLLNNFVGGIITDELHKKYKNNKIFIYYYIKNNKLDAPYKNLNCSGYDILSSNTTTLRTGFTGTLFYPSIVDCDDSNKIELYKYTNDFELIDNMILYNSYIDNPNKYPKIYHVNYNNILSDICNVIKKESITCLIDVESFLINYTSEQVARYLIKELNYVNYVIYISPDNKILYVNKNEEILEYYGNLDVNKQFVYYDQRHITGIDIKQSIVTKGIVTFRKISTYRNMAQGIYRLRALGNHQTINYLILSNDDVKNITSTHDILNVLKNNEIESSIMKESIGKIQNSYTLCRSMYNKYFIVKNLIKNDNIDEKIYVKLTSEQYKKSYIEQKIKMFPESIKLVIMNRLNENPTSLTIFGNNKQNIEYVSSYLQKSKQYIQKIIDNEILAETEMEITNVNEQIDMYHKNNIDLMLPLMHYDIKYINEKNSFYQLLMTTNDNQNKLIIMSSSVMHKILLSNNSVNVCCYCAKKPNNNEIYIIFISPIEFKILNNSNIKNCHVINTLNNIEDNDDHYYKLSYTLSSLVCYFKLKKRKPEDFKKIWNCLWQISPSHFHITSALINLYIDNDNTDEYLYTCLLKNYTKHYTNLQIVLCNYVLATDKKTFVNNNSRIIKKYNLYDKYFNSDLPETTKHNKLIEKLFNNDNTDYSIIRPLKKIEHIYFIDECYMIKKLNNCYSFKRGNYLEYFNHLGQYLNKDDVVNDNNNMTVKKIFTIKLKEMYDNGLRLVLWNNNCHISFIHNYSNEIMPLFNQLYFLIYKYKFGDDMFFKQFYINNNIFDQLFIISFMNKNILLFYSTTNSFNKICIWENKYGIPNDVTHILESNNNILFYFLHTNIVEYIIPLNIDFGNTISQFPMNELKIKNPTNINVINNEFVHFTILTKYNLIMTIHDFNIYKLSKSQENYQIIFDNVVLIVNNGILEKILDDPSTAITKNRKFITRINNYIIFNVYRRQNITRVLYVNQKTNTLFLTSNLDIIDPYSENYCNLIETQIINSINKPIKKIIYYDNMYTNVLFLINEDNEWSVANINNSINVAYQEYIFDELK